MILAGLIFAAIVYIGATIWDYRLQVFQKKNDTTGEFAGLVPTWHFAGNPNKGQYNIAGAIIAFVAAIVIGIVGNL